MNSFVEQVDIYEQEQPDGRILKHIKFRFPIFFDDEEIQDISWDNENTVETIVLLSNRKIKPDSHVRLSLDMEDYYRFVDQRK